MRRILLIVGPLISAIVFLSVFQFVLSKNSGKGALQITSEPKSDVFLNGKLIGQTPMCKCEPKEMLSVGEYKLKLVAKEGSFSPYQENIKINKSVLTVVDRTFGIESTVNSEGSVITLQKLKNSKTVELLILSFPQDSTVYIDENKKGNTPLLLKDLTASDHEVRLERKGYKEKTVRIHTVSGFKLSSIIYLSIDENAPDLSLKEASPSATPSLVQKVPQVIILETPTGFLRVRSEASFNGLEVTRVTPGESFELIEEEGEWFKIKLKDGKEGWVSSQYSKKE